MERTDNVDVDLDLEPGQTALDAIVVRELRRDDLRRLVQIDRTATGVDRTGYYEKRLEAAVGESGVQVSLAAEIEDLLVGFVIGRVYYGEYGHLDTYATIDTIGVDPEFRGRGVALALLDQLIRNLRGLRVERIQTEVEWDQWDLLALLRRVGFRPAPRIALDYLLTP